MCDSLFKINPGLSSEVLSKVPMCKTPMMCVKEKVHLLDSLVHIGVMVPPAGSARMMNQLY